MKLKMLMMMLTLSVWFLAHGSGDDSQTNTLADKRDVERLIMLAPTMMLSQTNNVQDYMEHVCKTIEKCPDAQMRYSYFRRLMACACMVDLANVEDLVPKEKIEIPKETGPWKGLSKEAAIERAERNRKYKITSIRRDGVGRLRRMAENISSTLLMEMPTPAPGVELFEPYFKLLEKLREEEQRENLEPMSLCSRSIDQVEYLFNFTHLKVLEMVGVKPDAQDRAAVEARFIQLVGRRIRSAEQYGADSRRRVMKNTQDHKAREAAIQ